MSHGWKGLEMGAANKWTVEPHPLGKPLGMALAVSLALHACFYVAYQAVRGWHWAGYDQVMALLTPKPSRLPPVLLELFKKPPKPDSLLAANPSVQRPPKEPPLMFVAVDPMVATENPPEKARYYSDKNSIAANPVIKKPSEIPNVDGKQKDIPFTMENPKPVIKPDLEQNPKPSPPDKKAAVEKPPDKNPEQSPNEQPLVPEKRPPPLRAQHPGDLALAKPSERINPREEGRDDGQGDGPEVRGAQPLQPSRPRTLIEARSRMQDNPIAGRKMEQEGGVPRRLEFSALDARATPFGAYDNALVAAIQQCWYDLLEQSKFAGDDRGRVVVEFRLHSNGQVSGLKISECTVKEFLGMICQTAISKPAPYPKWPPEMQRLFDGDFRDVRFTFFYN